MAEALSAERARAQAWEMMLAKAKEAHDADPKAAASAKTLLSDPAWKEVIEAGVTASQTSATEEKTAAGVAADGVPEGYTLVPCTVKYPGYIGGKLAFGVDDFDEARTDEVGTLVIENIQWGFAGSE